MGPLNNTFFVWGMELDSEREYNIVVISLLPLQTIWHAIRFIFLSLEPVNVKTQDLWSGTAGKTMGKCKYRYWIHEWIRIEDTKPSLATWINYNWRKKLCGTVVQINIFLPLKGNYCANINTIVFKLASLSYTSAIFYELVSIRMMSALSF